MSSAALADVSDAVMVEVDRKFMVEVNKKVAECYLAGKNYTLIQQRLAVLHSFSPSLLSRRPQLSEEIRSLEAVLNTYDSICVKK